MDKGKMHVIGKGKKGNGSVGIYKLTNHSEEVQAATLLVTSLAPNYYTTMGYSKNVIGMKEKCRHGYMNNTCFVSSIVQSQDLINAAHIDINDKSESISTWTEKCVGTAKDWYFVMPNTTRDGKSAIIIALRHGVTIKWDGRSIMHCSTVNIIGGSNHVYGTYFGSK